MHHFVLTWIVILAVVPAAASLGGSSVARAAGPELPAAPGSSKSGDDKEFKLRSSEGSKDAHGAHPSKIKPTRSEAALKFFVLDKDKGPVEGVVVSLTGPDGKKFYTDETDREGYAEVLVPVSQKYDLAYLSLARREIAMTVDVDSKPNSSIKLTLRYKRERPPPTAEPAPAPRFVLAGVKFDTAKATIRPESFPQLDSVVEFMAHKKGVRIEISGHTDNVGNAKANKTLSLKRAQACRAYVMSKGIDGSRIEAVGFGDEKPVAGNDKEEGRQQNRRIEAREL